MNEQKRIIKRSEAKTAGLLRYFTGKSCNGGHVAERLVSNGVCLTCHSQTYQAKQMDSPKGYLTNKYLGMKWRTDGKPMKSEYASRIYKGLGLMPKQEFLDWALKDPTFNTLFEAYKRSGKPIQLAPSIDRIDTQRGYVKGNVQFLTHAANAKKACNWRHHGINEATYTEAA